MEIQDLYELYKLYPHITTDTRNCQKDSIFFSLKGVNFNGNAYAKKALESGCRYAIVDEPEYADDSENIILVEDVLKTLQRLANYHRSKFRIPVIAITGTNGKTTTKELVAAVLSQSYNVLSTKGNLNNHIGVPLTLLKLTKEHEIAVIEMGANHVGEIMELAKIADPNYGLITNIGFAHLEGFGSYENIKKTKSELYEYLRNRDEGKIFLNHDDDFLRSISQGMITIEYGKEETLFVVGEDVSANPFLSFKWRFSMKYHTVNTKLIGTYNFPNVLAAIAIGKYFGIKSSMVCKAIEEYTPTNNRSQFNETDNNKLIIDAYNANPTSMIAALSNFSAMNTLPKAVILGDMKELGDASQEEHKKIINYLTAHPFEKTFLVGENFGEVGKGYIHFENVSALNRFLSENPLKGYCILIKGSRGMELEKTVSYL